MLLRYQIFADTQKLHFYKCQISTLNSFAYTVVNINFLFVIRSDNGLLKAETCSFWFYTMT